MGGVKIKKIKSSSILEVVVSLVLITIVFSISFMIYHNVMRSGISIQQMLASKKIEGYFTKTKTEKSFVNETIEEDDFIIQKKVSQFDNQPKIYKIEFEAYNKEQRLLAYQRSIWVKE